MLLAPLAHDWPRLSAEHQERFAAIARHADSLSPAQRQRLHDNLKHWSMLSEAEQARARRNWRLISSLPPEQRKKVLERLKTPVR